MIPRTEIVGISINDSIESYAKNLFRQGTPKFWYLKKIWTI